ncbi:precorrin-8X methylmutase [Asanoa sp. NPDC049573]|uniref:precorrin-8X methylmutase n=1 Tax=Asanoa sp. NPDC049573 TaxID=3155396 RepID=UPI0034338992
MKRAVHPIEAESYRILRAEADTTGLPRHTRDVVERIIHTTADPGWRDDLVTDEGALVAGAAALAGGAALVTDVTMVAAGVTAYPATCLVAAPEAADLARTAGPTDPADPTRETGLTRSAAGIRLAAGRHPDGAVWVIGNAPTALAELIRLAEAGTVRPALVIGLPVGYVGAAESKAALRRTALPQLSNRSARGGAAVAAAAVNALLYGDPLA